MGFFSSLKKVFNPGGALLSSYVGDGHNYRDPFEYMMKGGENAKKNQEAQKAAQQAAAQSMVKAPYTPAPGGVNSFPATKLGWTTGGYTYHNNPFSLQAPQGGGSMPVAGAQPQGPPTMQTPQDPQRILAMALRNGQRAV